MRRRALRSLPSLAALGASFPITALAGEESAVSQLGPLVARATLSLAAVVGVIIGLAFLLRKLQAHVEKRPRTGRLRSRARLDLGQRREVRIVEADGRCLLLGVTAGSVSLIADLDSVDEAGQGGAADAGLRVLPNVPGT